MRTLKPVVIGCLFLLAAPCWAQQDDPKSANTGHWRGVYHYPQGLANDPIKFNLFMVQNGSTIAGFIKEPNSFGRQGQPWLHALIKGTVDARTGEIKYTKTYDGTGGQGHDVVYNGNFANNGTAVQGNWAIGGDFVGTFTLLKVSNTRSGPLAGLWSGTYHYPEGSGREPVKFTTVMVHDGQGVAGMMKEANTFGIPNEPWLHAGFKGRFDNQTGKLTFTKTYDGTAGEDHDVEYSGSLSRDGNKLEGTWSLRDELGGRFTLEKTTLDAATLRDLR